MASDDLSPLDQSGKLQKAEAGDIDIKAFEIPKDTDYATWDYHAIVRVFTGQGDLNRAGTPNTPWDRGIPDPQTLYRAAAVLADTGSAIGRTRSELSALATSLNNGDWWSGPAASAIGNVLIQADNVLYDHESIMYDHGDNLNTAAASLSYTADYIRTVMHDGRVALENWWNGLPSGARKTWVEWMGNQPPIGPGGARYDDYPELASGMAVRMREALSNLAVTYRTGIANMPSPGPANLQGTGGGGGAFNPLNSGLTDPPKMPGLDGLLDPGAPGMPGLDGLLDPGAPGMPGLDSAGFGELGGSAGPGAPLPMPPGLDTAGPAGLGDVTGPGGAFGPSGA
ncbi:hypothetical protein ACWEQF_35435, partial [Streptomyces chartreusis]